MQLKLNQDIRKGDITFKKDEIISIAGDENNIPLDLFWRSRLKDSATDNCVELVEQEKPTKKNK